MLKMEEDTQASHTPCVYVCPELRVTTTVLQKYGVQPASGCPSSSPSPTTSENCAQEVMVIKFCDTEEENSDCSIPTVSQFLVQLCRQHKVLKNEQTTVLSPADQCQALQLCLAQKNQQTGSGFDVDSGQVLEEMTRMERHRLASTLGRLGVGGWGQLLEGEDTMPDMADFQTFMAACNHADLPQLLELLAVEMSAGGAVLSQLCKTRLLLLGRPASLLESAVGSVLCWTRAVVKVGEDLEEEVKDLSSLFPPSPAVSNSVQPELSPSAQFVHRVIESYMQLVVNSRSELALAAVFNVPDRKLSHAAFTALKHQSRIKHMSMYQTANSFILQLRLGGRGYMPPRDCPLMQHCGGLGLLVDAIHHLQAFLEDDPHPGSACRRVVSSVRGLLAKWPGYKLDTQALDSVTADMQGQLDLILAEEERLAKASPEKTASQGGSVLGRKAMRLLRSFLDRSAASHRGDYSAWLQDMLLHPNTPTRHPCALSLYRSPVPPPLPSPQDPAPPQQERKKGLTLSNKAHSSVAIMEKEGFSQQSKWDAHKLNSVIVFPSKTLVAPAEGTHAALLGVPDKKKADRLRSDKENASHASGIHALSSPVNKLSKKTKRPTGIEEPNRHPSSVASPKTGAKGRKAAGKKSCRRRILPPIKGQPSITSFFRV